MNVLQTLVLIMVHAPISLEITAVIAVLGYTGRNCEVDINECSSNPCLNHGTCSDLIGNYSCNCVLGYTGRNCEVDINECSSNPCLNHGTCSDLIGNYRL